MPMKENACGKIFLYKTSDEMKFETSQFRNIFNFLKIYKRKRKLSFAHVSQHVTFLKNLTFRENLLLDSLPSHLTENKDAVLEKFLVKNRNLYFQELFQKVEFWNKKPSEVNLQQKALFSLVRSLIKKSKIIILEMPETIFEPELVSIIQKALVYEVQNNGVDLVIYTEDQQQQWHNLCDKIVHHKKNTPFKVSDNSQNAVKPHFNEFIIEKKSA